MDFIDPNWTIKNDRQSVTVGINTRLWILRQQKMLPTLIRLGKEHTRLFLKEHGLWFIPNGPTPLLSKHLVWDVNNCRWCYTERMIPIKFNDSSIHGIAIEGIKNPKIKAPC